MKSINILVIDDSDEILKTFGNKLRESGYFILKVGFSELKIMEYVKTFTPEVLLISIERKSASAAFGLIKQIRCISRIPIICVFENVDEEDIKKAVEWNTAGIFIMPVHAVEIISGIELALKNTELERKVKEKEDSLELVFDNSHDALIWFEPETCQINKCNRKAQKLFEMRENDLLESSIEKLFPEIDFNKSEPEKLYTDIEQKRETEILSSSGQKKTIKLKTKKGIIDNKQIIQIAFHKLLEKNNEIVYLSDPINDARLGTGISFNQNVYCESVNPPVCTMFDCSRLEFIQKGITAYIAPDKLEETILHIDKAKKSDEYVFETDHISKDGKRFRAMHIVSNHFDEEKNFIARTVCILEINERSKIQSLTLSEEDKFGNIFDDAPIPIFEEDFSEVKEYFNFLTKTGVKDFSKYFEKNPEALQKCASLIRITDINKEGLKFFNSSSKNDFPIDFAGRLIKEAYNIFKDEMVCFASGKTIYEGEASLIAGGGEKKNVILRIKLTPGYEKTLKRVLVSVFDISERKLAEENIKNTLREKEILLKEIHHRVKNNLQIISSLLNLQSEYIKDEESKELFYDSLNRIRSMALIHERLYQSKDFSKISVPDYIKDVTNYLLRTYKNKTRDVQIKIDVDGMALSINTAIPIGLIINEIVSNSLKYAFAGRSSGLIEVIMKKLENNSYSLILRDDGIGIPESVDFKNSKSLGLQLVNNLIEQLEASVETDRTNGTTFRIIFTINEK